MARKKKHPEHANHERWLVSYADFMTLLFAFFVVMYAMGQIDLQKLAKLSKSMHSAFDVQIQSGTNPEMSSSDGILDGVSQEELFSSERPMIVPTQNEEQIPQASGAEPDVNVTVLDQVASDLKEKFADVNMDDKIKLKTETRGWVISLAEKTFFNSGEAEMKTDALGILDSIANTILKFPNQIRVEGHTDNTPIHTTRFPSNWELSTARATFVINYFLSRFAFEPKRLSAAGYGEYHPLSDNNTPEGRAENRRVDIVLLNEASESQEPQ